MIFELNCFEFRTISLGRFFAPLLPNERRSVDQSKVNGTAFGYFKLCDWATIGDKINIIGCETKGNEITEQEYLVRDQIRSTLINDPQNFTILNKGLVITCSSCYRDAKTNKIFVDIPNKNYGLVDGRSTNAVIMEYMSAVGDRNVFAIQDGKPGVTNAKTAMVQIEFIIIPEIKAGESERISALRNKVEINNIVKPAQSKYELYELLAKDQRLSPEFAKYSRLGFMHPLFQVESNKILSLLALFGKGIDPVYVYTGGFSQVFDIKYVTDLFPLAGDILCLHDHIMSHFDTYWESRPKASQVPDIFTLGLVSKTESYHLTYTGSTCNVHVANTLLYPLMYGMSAFLQVDEQYDGDENWQNLSQPADLHLFLKPAWRRDFKKILTVVDQIMPYVLAELASGFNRLNIDMAWGKEPILYQKSFNSIFQRSLKKIDFSKPVPVRTGIVGGRAVGKAHRQQRSESQ